MSRESSLREECEPHGFTFDTYAPGDGVKRYRFATLGSDSAVDYFAGDGDFTALGWREALAYAIGRIDGANQ